MKYTHLKATQEILRAMESDEINSISDTVESVSVAQLLEAVYYDLATELGLEEHDGFFELNASGDVAKPTLMTLPTNITRWDWIEYDIIDTGETYANHRRLEFVPIDEFVEMQNSLRGQTSGVGQMNVTSNGETFPIMYRSDKQPQYFTTYDDDNILFDSYDSSVDSTLQKSKTRCYGATYPTFTQSDAFIPDLHPTQFSYYINKAKLRAFAELKQTTNPEVARETRNQKIRVQVNRRTTPDRPEVFKVARYGRKTNINTIPNNLRQGD